ncbi:MFS transporter [Serratia marcescens]|uniref:MDR family MFS transporter n=1 Tax=Serratia marcescens TaxID=615 RepID=UPI000CDD1B49|nr:MDR family MFS transporter [Serratia marcescens]POW87170.1 MFS transporter [Serratia marcescens]POW92424.1 MFS transporter [Serratia marcescens]POX06988.1 MFS transporter [Serratia marcescens]POX10842.1 MFS transporter [Serratia marcescens]
MTNNVSPAPITHRPLILIACMLAMFMSAIEATIVATAMPTIIGDLGGFSLLGWVFAVYLLAQAITIPIYGRLADLYGRKRVFFFGATLFLLGSVLCGFAPDMYWLIGFRLLQGLGAGAIMPIASTIIGDIYSASERPKVMGYLSSVWGVSAIIGPLLGAFIVQHLPWALVFWVNLPIGLLAMLFLWRYLPAHQQLRRHALDLAGTAWLTLFVSALLLALLQMESLGWWVAPLLALAAASLALLVRQERRAVEPLFPLALWQSRVIVAGNIGGLVIGAAMMGISAFLPTFIQGVMGGSPLEAGTTLALMSIGWPLASTLSGRLMLMTSYRATALLGALLLVAGGLILLMLQPTGGLLWGRVAAFMVGAGMGLCNTTFLVSVQNAAHYSIRGIATACTVFTRMVGSAIGTAILGATLNLNLQWRLPEVDDPVQRLMEPAVRQSMGSEALAQLIQQVAASLHWVFLASALVSLLALAAAMLIPARCRPQGEGEEAEQA